MKNADKNRDPKKALGRAPNDAACALRKLGLLDRLALWQEQRSTGADVDLEGLELLHEVAEAIILPRHIEEAKRNA